ncbi:MAG: hypothetical protein AAF847_12460 [Bacteroidota bacterium]
MPKDIEGDSVVGIVSKSALKIGIERIVKVVREFVENKLPKFCEAIFSLVKAKNAGIAGLRRGFST